MTLNGTTTSWPCDSTSFQPMLCFLLAAESLIGLTSLLLNCAAAISSYYAQPLSVEHRQSLGAISFNYVLISGFILARASFLIFSVYTMCNTTVNTLNCKLQEFPLVFVYIQAALLAILLGLQFLHKSNDNASKQITWTNACSVHQIFVAICSMFLALFFTGFDEELGHKYLQHCIFLRAIHQKEITFSLLATLIFLHSIALLIWQVLLQRWNANRFMTFTNQISEHMCNLECISWLFVLLTTGLILLYDYVVINVDELLINIAYETILVICPVILCFVRALATFWCVMPVRFAAQQLFPFAHHFLHFDY